MAPGWEHHGWTRMLPGCQQVCRGAGGSAGVLVVRQGAGGSVGVLWPPIQQPASCVLPTTCWPAEGGRPAMSCLNREGGGTGMELQRLWTGCQEVQSGSSSLKWSRFGFYFQPLKSLDTLFSELLGCCWVWGVSQPGWLLDFATGCVFAADPSSQQRRGADGWPGSAAPGPPRRPGGEGWMSLRVKWNHLARDGHPTWGCASPALGGGGSVGWCGLRVSPPRFPAGLRCEGIVCYLTGYSGHAVLPAIPAAGPPPRVTPALGWGLHPCQPPPVQWGLLEGLSSHSTFNCFLFSQILCIFKPTSIWAWAKVKLQKLCVAVPGFHCTETKSKGDFPRALGLV